MYSVVLSSMFSLGATTADCCWHRYAPVSCAGCAAPMPVMEMPVGCGCCPPPCPTCGEMPPMAGPMIGGMEPSPMIGGMGAPMVAPPMIGETGVPPIAGSVLPPAPPGATLPPVTPPALGETRASANQAMFVVRLPADARLIADGTPIPGDGPVRVFVSPPLEPGRKYVYDLTIEVNRGGKVLTDKQTIEFESGKTANVTFGEPPLESPPPPPANPMSPKSTRIRVRMPEGAALYVEGRPWASPVVLTPPLDPNQTHYYRFAVATIRNGRREVSAREVAFRAGQDVIVDFTSR